MSIEMNELFAEMTDMEAYVIQGGLNTVTGWSFNVPLFTPLDPEAALKSTTSLASARGNAANYSFFNVFNNLTNYSSNTATTIKRSGFAMGGAGVGSVPLGTSGGNPSVPNSNYFQVILEGV